MKNITSIDFIHDDRNDLYKVRRTDGQGLGGILPKGIVQTIIIEEAVLKGDTVVDTSLRPSMFFSSTGNMAIVSFSGRVFFQEDVDKILLHSEWEEKGSRGLMKFFPLFSNKRDRK